MYTDYTDEEETNESYYDDSENNNNLDKEKMKRIAFFIIAFVIVVILIIVIAKSCSREKTNNLGSSNNQVLPSLAISRPNISIKVNESFELFVDVVNSKVENPVITWWSEDTNIAVVSDEGVVTGVKEGTVKVVAVYAEGKKVISTKCVVTVSKNQAEVTGIDITQENIVIPKNGEVLLQVEVTPKNAAVPKLVFESDNPSIVSVSKDGYIKGITSGFTTVRVKTEDGKFNDSLTVRVVDTSGSTVINPVSIRINDLSNGISVGTSARIDYEVLPTNATNKTVTWASTNSNIAKVSSDGVVTGVSAGKATIVASTSNGVTGRVEVTVMANKVAVQSIKINGDNQITVTEGGTKILSYTISPSNATNKKVTFTSSNKNAVYIDSQGVMAFLNPGSSLITIKTEDGNKTAQAIVYVRSKDSSSSSSGSSGSTSSGGTSSGSSGSTSASGGGTSSSGSGVTCDSQSMVTISHNGSSQTPNKAIISSVKFEQAYPFKTVATPTITVDAINSCIDTSKLYYNVYYGTTKNNISTDIKATAKISKGTKIKLQNGNGYYKIEVKGLIAGSNNVMVNKIYYAIVEKTSSTSSAPIYMTGISGIVKSGILEISVRGYDMGGPGIKLYKYCLSPTETCNFEASNGTTQVGKYIISGYPTTNSQKISMVYNSKYNYVCAKAVDKNDKESSPMCTKLIK